MPADAVRAVEPVPSQQQAPAQSRAAVPSGTAIASDAVVSPSSASVVTAPANAGHASMSAAIAPGTPTGVVVRAPATVPERIDGPVERQSTGEFLLRAAVGLPVGLLCFLAMLVGIPFVLAASAATDGAVDVEAFVDVMTTPMNAILSPEGRPPW